MEKCRKVIRETEEYRQLEQRYEEKDWKIYREYDCEANKFDYRKFKNRKS